MTVSFSKDVSRNSRVGSENSEDPKKTIGLQTLVSGEELLALVKIHPVDEQDPVQVIEFVLNDASKEILHFHFHRFPLTIQGTKPDDLCPRNFARDIIQSPPTPIMTLTGY